MSAPLLTASDLAQLDAELAALRNRPATCPNTDDGLDSDALVYDADGGIRYRLEWHRGDSGPGLSTAAYPARGSVWLHDADEWRACYGEGLPTQSLIEEIVDAEVERMGERDRRAWHRRMA